MAQIQFSLIKKIKIGRPEYLLTPHLTTSDSISAITAENNNTLWQHLIYQDMRVKVFKNEPSEICGKQPSKILK